MSAAPPRVPELAPSLGRLLVPRRRTECRCHRQQNKGNERQGGHCPPSEACGGQGPPYGLSHPPATKRESVRTNWTANST